MLILTLSKKLNRFVGPLLLKYGLKARFALGSGLRDSPTLDALLLLPWSMKVLSLEVHDETSQQLAQQQQQYISNIQSKPSSKKDRSVRSQVLERYLRPTLLPNETWADVMHWQFHSRLLKWVRSEYLWAEHGEHVQLALQGFSTLGKTHQLLPPRDRRDQKSHLESLSFGSLPSSSLLADAFDLRDWTTDKNWSATGRDMARIAQKVGGRVVEVGTMIRIVDLDPTTKMSELSFAEVLELAGAYIEQSGPLNALCEKRNIFQVWTREYVEMLGRYLLKRTAAHHNGDTIVIDVGAGDGLLAHFLRESFENTAPAGDTRQASRCGSSADEKRKIPIVIATDDGSWRISQVARVEPLSVEETIEKYAARTAGSSSGGESDNSCQVIVLCSWMPMNEDWTRIFRRAQVDEYILIGECDEGQCGDNWLTFGNRQYLADIEQELLAAFSDAKNGGDVESNGRARQQDATPTPRPYEDDSYKRKNLDSLAPYQFSRFDCRVSKVGRTVSFRRK